MKKEKTSYSPLPGNNDTEKLTDLHSSYTDPSNYARNLHKNNTSLKDSKNRYNSSNRSIKSEQNSDSTERIPTLIKYSDINNDDDEFDFKGEI